MKWFNENHFLVETGSIISWNILWIQKSVFGIEYSIKTDYTFLLTLFFSKIIWKNDSISFFTYFCFHFRLFSFQKFHHSHVSLPECPNSIRLVTLYVIWISLIENHQIIQDKRIINNRNLKSEKKKYENISLPLHMARNCMHVYRH